MGEQQVVVNYGSQQPQPQVVVVRTQKSKGLAYLLWFFLGGIGIHRFYLESPVAGIILILLFIVNWFLWVTWIITALWLFIDLFWINGRVNNLNRGGLA